MRDAQPVTQVLGRRTRCRIGQLCQLGRHSVPLSFAGTASRRATLGWLFQIGSTRCLCRRLCRSWPHAMPPGVALCSAPDAVQSPKALPATVPRGVAGSNFADDAARGASIDGVPADGVPAWTPYGASTCGLQAPRGAQLVRRASSGSIRCLRPRFAGARHHAMSSRWRLAAHGAPPATWHQQ